MVKLHYNQFIIQNKILPILKEIDQNLSTAIQTGNTLSIPYDFTRRGEVQNILQELINVRIQLNGIGENVQKSISAVATLQDNFESKANAIPLLNIEKRATHF